MPGELSGLKTGVCVAHAGDMGDPSGGTNRVTAIVAGLRERGAEVTLVVPAFEGDHPPRLEGVQVVEVQRRNGVADALGVARRASQIAAERDAVLQYEHSLLGGVGTFVGASDYVLDMHDLAYSRFDHVETALAPVYRRVVSRIERRAIAHARHVVVVSDHMADLVHERWNAPRERLSTVPNGYFPETVAVATDVEPVPGRVSFLGTLHPKVDLEALCRVARLSEVDELYVIGDGAQRDELAAMGERAGVESLRVTGRLPDERAFELLAGSQVAINPQRPSQLQRASSPVKLFYYAALGTPMVATAGPEPAARLAEAGAALLVGANEEFPRVVERVLTDDGLRASMAEQAITAAPDFRWSTRVDALVDIYRTLDTVQG